MANPTSPSAGQGKIWDIFAPESAKAYCAASHARADALDAIDQKDLAVEAIYVLDDEGEPLPDGFEPFPEAGDPVPCAEVRPSDDLFHCATPYRHPNRSATHGKWQNP